MSELYGLHPDFERLVAFCAAAYPEFYSRVGYELQATGFAHEGAKHTIEAVRQIAKDSGKGPTKVTQIVQRMQRWVTDGRVAFEAIREVIAYLDEAADWQGDLDQVIQEMAEVIKRRLSKEIAHAAVSAFQDKDYTLSKVQELMTRIAAVGKADMDQGTILTKDSLAEASEIIASMRTQHRMATGIFELDRELGGGLPFGQLGVVVGGAGAGKSMFLNQVACEAMVTGKRVLYATLELPKGTVLARAYANLLGVSIATINDLGLQTIAANYLDKVGFQGSLAVVEYTPKATTVETLRQSIAKVEERMGGPLDLLVLDYADKLGAPAETNDYKAMEAVYEALRLYTFRRGNLRTWTASQAKAKDKKNTRRLDIEDMSDSLNKGRVADLVVTLNIDEESKSISYWIAKNRTGQSKIAIEGVFGDISCGRIATLAHR